MAPRMPKRTEIKHFAPVNLINSGGEELDMDSSPSSSGSWHTLPVTQVFEPVKWARGLHLVGPQGGWGEAIP